MIIIVEGPDGLGKTTLCTELAGRLNCPVYKDHTPGLTNSRDYTFGHDTGSLGIALAIADKADIILDRSFPSEIAYSRAFGRKIDRAEYSLMDERTSMHSHLGVMLTSARGYQVVKERKNSDINPGAWKKVFDAYAMYLATSRMNWLVLEAETPTLIQVESVMRRLLESRDSSNSKHMVFMEMARQAARRSTCLSRRQGAVMLSESGHVISVGYNGSPVGFKHPDTCERLCAAVGMGRGLDGCNDVHAEENLIVHAARNGADPTGGSVYTIMSPCPRCARMLVNARISMIVYERVYDEAALEMLRRAGVSTLQIGG